MTPVLLALRFVLELALLTAFALAGWHLGQRPVAQWTLAIALPASCAALWGLLIAPKARLSARLGVRIGIELALFVSAAALLWAVELRTFAWVLVVGEVLVLCALLATGERPGRDSVAAAR